jgi:hypothetical protein
MNVVWSHAFMPRAAGGARSWAAWGCPRCAGIMLSELEIGGGQGAGPIGGQVAVAETDSLPAGEHRQYAVEHLPEDVKAFFSDAQRVMDAGVPDAAAVQLRRTLEAAAAHKGVSGRALVASIQQLIKDGYVTKDFGAVLHHVRKIGNIGAHASDERVSDAELSRAMRFTTQVLRNLFEVPGELAILRAEQVPPDEDQGSTD